MKRRRNPESGFALLLIFLLAAIVAISLYMEIPRVAFETQRQREQLLIERGEQYKRAIQVFYLTNKRWPGKVEDLENFNNRRFLRRRYIDPMTGQDEWRIVHINNGILTDSKVKPQGQGDKKDSTASNGPAYVGELQGMDQPTNSGQAGISMANRRRASDGNLPPIGADGQPAPADPNNPQGTPADGQTPSPTAGPVPTGTPGVPVVGGVPGQALGIAGMPGRIGGQAQPGQAQGGAGGGSYIGSGSYIGGGTSSQGGQGTPSFGQGLNPGMPGAPGNPQQGGFGSQQPGMNPALNTDGQNPALRTIGQILGGPRPGGPPAAAGGMGGQVMGGGLAGVASNADLESIMVYQDRSNYGEWEFIFDPTKWRPPPNPLSGGLGVGVGTGMGTPTASPGIGGAPGTGMGTPPAGTPPAGGPGGGKSQ